MSSEYPADLNSYEIGEKENFVPILRQSRIFDKLELSELEWISGFFDEQFYKVGEYVFTANDQGNRLYVLAEGSLLLEMSGEIIKTYKPGEIFGEVALINNQLRSGSIRALKPSRLLSILGDDLLNTKKLGPSTVLKIYREMAILVTSYLKNEKTTSTIQLIAEGESEKLEFKSTLRMNLHTNKADKKIEDSVLKTICAFLNSEGGTLLIGVRDNGTIFGTEADVFSNADKMMLHLTNMVKDRISPGQMSFIHSSTEMISGKRILRVDVDPSTIPAYMMTSSNREVFFIRTGPATSELPVSQVFIYIKNRFKKFENT